MAEVVTILTIVGKSLSLIQTISSYASRYNYSPLELTMIHVHSTTIRNALLRIDGLLSENLLWAARESSQDRSVFEEYERTLGLCASMFSMLNERMQRVCSTCLTAKNEVRFKSRLNRMWKEQEMDKLQRSMDSLASAINLQLSVFSRYGFNYCPSGIAAKH
jgi:hypothetical protein